MAYRDYVCDPEAGGCGHAFEAEQNVKDPPLRRCPECGKRKLRQVFGVPTLVFKGEGWVPSGNATDLSYRKDAKGE